MHWHLADQGWRFPTEDETNVDGADVTPDPVHGAGFTHLRQVYFESAPDYEGRFTVPVLYDKTRKCIVNNESSEILRMLGTVVGALLQLLLITRGLSLSTNNLVLSATM